MRFLKFQVIFGHVVSHCQCIKICPKLPKFAQRQNFEMPPIIKILFFLRNKKLMNIEEAPKHVSTIWIFNPRIFHMLFLLLKTAFVFEFQHIPLCKMIFFSRFTKNTELTIHALGGLNMHLLSVD
jgi:hypothetical protein